MSLSCPILYLVAALVLAVWPHEPVQAEPARPVHTPAPYRPAALAASSDVRRPLPVVSPTATPPSESVGAAPPASVTTQVINLIMPATGPLPEAGDVVVRLEAAPGASHVELRVRRAAPDERAPAPAPAPASASAPPPSATSSPPPAPTPAPTPPEPAAPLARRAALTVAAPFVTELYPEGGLDVGPGAVPRAELAGWLDVAPGWSFSSALAYQRYTLVDTQHAPSRHQRQDIQAQAGAWRALPTGTPVWAGLGYWGRLVSVTHSLPPPLTTPLVTSPSQLYHGPQALLRAEWAIARDWALSAQAAARPYLLAVGDEAVGPLAPLHGLGAVAELSHRLGERLAIVAGLSYDRHAAYGAAFAHTELGPVLRLEGSF